MTGFLTWLLGSKVGRMAAGAVLIVSVIIGSLKAASRSGERKKAAKASAARIKSLQTALRANNEITNMSADERRAYVARWLSDSTK